MNYLIAIVGATCTGKSVLAVRLAKEFSTETISADSRQIYKHLNIGTAKPTLEERNGIIHHFIDYLELTENYNAGKFEHDALAVLESVYKKTNVAIAVGGTGLYVHALLNGLDVMFETNPQLRELLNLRLETEGLDSLLNELKEKDLQVYEAVDKKNPRRVIRALEKLSLQTSTKPIPRNFFPIKIGLQVNRNELYERINQRVDKMIEAGLENEVRNILKRYKFSSISQAMDSVGYKEMVSYINGEVSSEKTIDLIKQHTRNYAKRQLTWFRRDKEIKWFHPEAYDEIREFISERMK